MIGRTTTIASTAGLHARPAAILAAAAAEYDDLEITIAAAGVPVQEAMGATSVVPLLDCQNATGMNAHPVTSP